MNRLTENKIVIVTRRTRLDELIARFNTIGQAQFYVEHLGADFADYRAEHDQYYAALEGASAALSNMGRVQTIDRGFLSNFIFGPSDTIVALGQDGLVANTLKYLDAQPLVGVNPDPTRWDGVLLPFAVPDLEKIIPEVFAKRRQIKEVTMAQIELNDGQKMYAVNDFFIGPRSHVSARYRISVGEREERQSSSGVIVSTGLGSTGWLKSVVAGAAAIAGKVNGRDKPSGTELPAMPWDARYLYFSVREPFPSRNTSAELVFGRVTGKRPLRILSEMPEHGCIFSDGIEADYLAFNSGARATVTPAAKRGHLVV